MNKSDWQAEYVAKITESQRRIYAYIISIAPPGMSVDDVLQETNIVLWKKIDEFEPGSNFIAWAFSIARFQVMAAVKKYKRQSWLTFDQDILDSLTRDFQDQMDNFETRHSHLRECLQELGPKETEIIQHRYYSEGNLEDYSKKIKASVTSLKQSLFRIRAALKKCIRNKLISEN